MAIWTENIVGNDEILQLRKASNEEAKDENLLDLADIVGSFIEHPINEVTKESVHLLSR